MDFGAKQYALQRKVMKLRAKEGISLKKAWARVKAAMKSKKQKKKSPKKKSPKKKPAKKTKKSKGAKGPSLGQLQGFASNANIPFTKKLVGGGYGKSPLTRTALKYRLTRNGVDWRNASTGSDFLSPVFPDTSAYSWDLSNAGPVPSRTFGNVPLSQQPSVATSDFLSPVFPDTSVYSLDSSNAGPAPSRTFTNVPLSQQSSNFGMRRW